MKNRNQSLLDMAVILSVACAAIAFDALLFTYT